MSNLPDLALERWEPTKDTLKLWTQIVGKVRLALAPRQNHLVARSLLRRRARTHNPPRSRLTR
jgi:hypothetical protein